MVGVSGRISNWLVGCEGADLEWLEAICSFAGEIRGPARAYSSGAPSPSAAFSASAFRFHSDSTLMNPVRLR